MATTEYEGQVLRPPGFKTGNSVAPPEEILAAYSPPPLIKGGTVASGVGVLRAGEPMVKSGKTWIKATYATATAVNKTATDATNDAKLINLILGGVINVNVQAIGAANGAALATSLGGTYFPDFGYIKF